MVTSAFAAADSPPFYCGGELGTVCCGNDMGSCVDVIPGLGSAVAAMLYSHQSDMLLIITKLNMLVQFKLADNKPVQVSKVKLSMGKEGLFSAIWAAPQQLAIVSADHVVRVSDLAADENYVLSLMDVGTNEALAVQRLVALGTEPGRGMLAGATREGTVVIWRPVPGAPADSPEKGWEAMSPVTLTSEPLEVAWGPGEGLVAARTAAGLSILPETILRRVMEGKWAVIQISATRLHLEHTGGTNFVIDTTMRISGCALSGNHVLLWSGSQLQVFKFDDSGTQRGEPELVSTVDSRARTAAIHRDSLYLCVGDRIEVTNFKGAVKSTMAMMDSEGEPTFVHVASHAKGAYLAVGTDKGFVKAWDISRREARQHTLGKKLLATPASRVTSLQIACDGSRISATLETQAPAAATGAARVGTAVAQAPWVRSGTLYVYLSEADTVQQHDFGAAGRVPCAHFWDPLESKLLAVETRPALAAQGKHSAAIEVTTIFSTAEVGLKVKDSFTADKDLESLISMQVPRFFFANFPAAATEEGARPAPRLCSRVMREFVGMENVDVTTQHALVDFSYYLSIGNMDEAHKAVKLIKNASVWENMAKMCVKTQRLDVAEICLGHMGHARGARAVRECIAAHTTADGVSEPAVCAAMVAVQLGQLEEAERLYEECGRYDLLNELLQASGEWERALKVAEEKDRIHLKTTHYSYARQLEAQGSIPEAIRHFELSDTHRVEVPRMLFDGADTVRLQSYVDKADDPDLNRWWAQFCESNGQFDKALQYYERAKDQLAIVRVLCFHEKFDRASEVVNESGDLAASYHLARQLEAKDRIKEAIFFYQRAQRFNHAVRLAKAHDMPSELTMLALQAPPRLMVEAAEYFEERSMPEKAVLLFQKGGHMAKALDLCFRCRLFDALREIADSLSSETDPAMLQRCAEFFLDHGQYEKTVHLFTIAGECAKALDLCVLHNITISEEMAERLCPPLGARGAEDEATRISLLAKIAKCCKRQGNYHLACKKYTQAGDKIKAMKCLLKSGDTQKIIYFAGVSRTRDIYVLAANYLQNLDWHSDGEIMKSIVSFYTKAKAFEQLASFYDACAQVEIDEYRDYEKAVGALREALAHINKARMPGKEQKVGALQQKISHVEAFVGARKMVKSDPAQMVRLCHELLEQHDVESAIRVGDVYALMVEWYYSQQQMEQAYSLIEKMRSRSIILSPYLDHEMVHAIYGAMGMPVAQDPPPPQGGQDDDGPDEVIDEDVEDD